MVEPLSALLMIICSFTFRLCRVCLCSLVRLSVFVCVMLVNLFDISFVVSSINVLRRGLGIGFVVAFEVVFFGMNLFRVFFGLYVSVGFVLWSSGMVFFLHCMLSCLLTDYTRKTPIGVTHARAAKRERRQLASAAVTLLYRSLTQHLKRLALTWHYQGFAEYLR